MAEIKARSMLLYGALFLFFFQLIADFVEGIYAFGLLGTSVPVEMVSLLVFFSPLILLGFRKRLPGSAVLLLGLGVLLCRVLEVALNTRGRMIVSAIGVGCFLTFFPALLCRPGRARPDAPTLGSGVAIAIGLSALFRALGSGFDISAQRGFQEIGWGLALVAGVLLLELRQRGQAAVGEDRLIEEGSPQVGRTIGLSLGLVSVWVLLYFGFVAPNVVARWTGASYVGVIALVACALVAFAVLMLFAPRLAALLTPEAIWAWNVLFIVALVLAIQPYQIAFPPDPSAYPLFEPPVSLLFRVPLGLMLLSLPVLLIDWILLVQALLQPIQTPRALGAGFVLSMLFFLLAVLGQVFTTVYDYIPVIGPFFRDRFWLVLLFPGLVLLLSLWLVRRDTFQRTWSAGASWHLPAGVAVLGVATVAGALFTAARPTAPAEPAPSLRVCTYNIQQGYDASSQKNYAGQLALLRRANADLIGLQESDTNRVAGGNADIVRYFADRLNLYSYYGPKTVPGTFGVALLSRYPIEEAKTFYMYSTGEQTATIAARVRVDDRLYNIRVTHLGNGGPMVQQEAVLREVVGLENVVLMGDFNFRPATPQYARTVELLDDAWLLRWPEGVDDQGRRFDGRIDHVFVSLGTAVLDALYITDPESDHPALVVEIER